MLFFIFTIFFIMIINILTKDKSFSEIENRTLTTISQEQNLEMQRSALQAQQQMQQQQVNAMNNYSNALRNQHVQVDANVYHSGTVNVNSNVNVNGNYTYRYW